MKQVINSLNYDPSRYKGEVNTKPSMTIPDQTMSIREIMERFARGLPVEGGKVPIYDEDNDLPDIRTLDLAERQELSEHYRNELAAMQRRKEGVAEKPPVPYEAGADPAGSQPAGRTGAEPAERPLRPAGSGQAGATEA